MLHYREGIIEEGRVLALHYRGYIREEVCVLALHYKGYKEEVLNDENKWATSYYWFCDIFEEPANIITAIGQMAPDQNTTTPEMIARVKSEHKKSSMTSLHVTFLVVTHVCGFIQQVMRYETSNLVLAGIYNNCLRSI